MFLGLQNVGIHDWHIHTTSDTPRQRRKLWRNQLLEFRLHLQAGSRQLLNEVFPIGCKNRELPWWGEFTGAWTDEEKDALSDSFWIPDNENLNIYFQKRFRKDSNLQNYHMNPCWAPLVLAYLYKVRVVLVTRTTSPPDKVTEPKGDSSKKTPKRVDCNYFHSVKVFDFAEDFEKDIDSYTPITEHAGAYRISDGTFNSKKTVELLFVTGFLDKGGEADNNHCLFLRRMFCVKTPTNIKILQTPLRQYLEYAQPIVENVELPPIENAEPIDEQNVESPSMQQPNLMQIDHVEPTDQINVEPPFIQPNLMQIDATKKAESSILLPLSHTATRRKWGLKDGTKKAAEKRVFKKKQNPKIVQKSTKTTDVPENDDDKNQSLVSNTDNHDYMYDTVSGNFFKAIFNSKLRRYLNKVRVTDISEIDQDTIDEAKQKPNTFVSPPLVDACDDTPLVHLLTKVKTLYEQLDNPFCLTYCLASALFYCGFRSQGEVLSAQAPDLAHLKMNRQLECIISFMPNLVPPIGEATVYGQRGSGNNRKKRSISWDNLFTDITPYPTLVIATPPDGRMTHAFCVVDDLIFNSSASHALKLSMDSINWIFHNQKVDIFVAYRFDKKGSPKGKKLKVKYTRQVTYHGTREAPPSKLTGLVNKSYDVECSYDQSDFPFVKHFLRMEI